jgi:hypothetical protein
MASIAPFQPWLDVRQHFHRIPFFPFVPLHPHVLRVTLRRLLLITDGFAARRAVRLIIMASAGPFQPWFYVV